MNKKIILGSGIGVLSLLAVGGFVYFGGVNGIGQVSANPDYICVKNVSGRPCEFNVETDCDSWQQNGTRVCNGKRTTQIGYYQVRTGCESGYTRSYTGQTGKSSTASRQVINAGYSSFLSSGGINAARKHPSSGRHSIDYPSQTESCSVVQVDTIAPIGELDINIVD